MDGVKQLGPNSPQVFVIRQWLKKVTYASLLADKLTLNV